MSYWKVLTASIALSLAMSAGAEEPIPKFIADRGGKVVESKPGPNGTTMYMVEKDKKKLVFFLSSDKKTAIVGALFDAQSGANLSDKFMPELPVKAEIQAPPMNTATSPAPSSPVAADDPRKAQILAAQRAVQGNMQDYLMSKEITGVMEGKGKEVTFVFFDPQCQYCHTLIRNTRAVTRDGGNAIKWIPVNTLGDAGVPVSAAFLDTGVKSLDAMALGTLAPKANTPNEQRQQIQQNTALLIMASKAIGMQVSTPTIMFKNPKSGKLAVAQGDARDKESYQAAFGVK